MGRHFREDENELPYLVYSKRDDGTRRGSSSYRHEVNIKDRPFGEFASAVRGLPIPIDDRNGIIRSVTVEPKNCRFSISSSDDGLLFEFVVENRYVVTSVRAVYENHGLRVYDFSTSHYKLENQEWFQNLLSAKSRELGLDFFYCSSGYRYDDSNGKLMIRDKCCVLAIFGDGDFFNDHPGYRVDFKNRKLVEYHVFAGHEVLGY